MDEVRDFDWTKRLPPEEVEPMLKRWLHCVQTGEDWEGEHHVLGPDGQYHTILTRGRPVRDDAGKIVGWAGINLDIDARKRAEQALLELTATLESKVADRTAELQHRSRQLQTLTLEMSAAEDRERQRQ